MDLKIEVQLSHVFQSACSSPQLTIEVGEGEATVQCLLRFLTQKYGEKIRPLLYEQGKDSFLSGLMVMVNDQVFTGSDLNRKVIELHDKDKVNLLYFVSGG